MTLLFVDIQNERVRRCFFNSRCYSWHLELNECRIQDCCVKVLTHAVSFASNDSYKQVWIISMLL